MAGPNEQKKNKLKEFGQKVTDDQRHEDTTGQTSDSSSDGGEIIKTHANTLDEGV